MTSSDAAFLASYPELPALLAAFTHAVLRDKPADLALYARDHFARAYEASRSLADAPP